MTLRFHAGQQYLAAGNIVVLDDNESHHLLRVMRAVPGTQVRVFAGGMEFRGRLLGRSGTLAEISLESPVDVPPPLRVALTFAVPWIRGGKIENVVQKLTELGACRIIAYHAAREVSKGDHNKLEKLSRTALEACKQCERAEVPLLLSAESVVAALESQALPRDNVFFMHERSNEPLLSAALKTYVTTNPSPGMLMFVSGPEGGFDSKEVEALQQFATPASLGPRILRAETAPITAAVVAMVAIGEI